MRILIGRYVVALALPILATAGSVRADEQLFRERIAPLFTAKCVICHQEPLPKGGLSLTSGSSALAGGDSGAVIAPGRPDESLLIEYVTGPSPIMPQEGEPLAESDVADLARWIAAGAAWPDDVTLSAPRADDEAWWSLAPWSRAEVPPSDSNWVRTPIDAFILDRLAREGLSPAPEADRRTLIRRLSYDLHGLPPTPEDVARFTSDGAPDAYERLVERLLASPRYGERWARHWLDVVHFGETHGYDKDKVRPNAWPYRDYVIGALNSDVPYGRFIEEQIAGDALFPDDPRGVVATGFIAAGPWDFVGHVELREGTVDKDIARSNDRDDMVASCASTFLSLTVHCARCHDHKFDPVRQADYYALQSVFAGVDRAERDYDASPEIWRLRSDLARRQEELSRRKRELDAVAAAVTSQEIAAADERLAALAQELSTLEAAPGQLSTTLGYHSQIMPEPEHVKWVQVDLGRSLPLRDVVLVPSHVVYGGHPGPGFGFPPRFQVLASQDADFETAEVLADATAADFPNPGDAPYRVSCEGTTARYVRVVATRLWKRTDDFVFALAELQVFTAGSQADAALGAAVSALDSIEAPPSWQMTNLVDGYGSLALLAESPGSNLARREELAGEIARVEEIRRAAVDRALDDATRRELRDVAAQLDETTERLAALPAPGSVYAAANRFAPQGNFTPAAAPRDVFILARGDVRRPGRPAAPGGVACVPGPAASFALPPGHDEGQRRAALARWLSDSRNVLVRRSIVNRVWHYHFGQGLVDTPNDFGRMGSLPSHPELVEWLAAWFVEQGESLKALHRLIVTSAVYRQSSQAGGDGSRIDAANRLLWRMNRQRLDAESVRDTLLFASGKLDAKMGGPSVQLFAFKDDHSPVYDYAAFAADDPRGFRRSVYRFLVRSVGDPFMECLDCADPSLLTPKRNTTLTALQALAMLNDAFLLRQAEHLAARVEREAAGGDRVETLYQLVLGRSAALHERDLVADYAARHGWAAACRVLLNTNEFLFVD